MSAPRVKHSTAQVLQQAAEWFTLLRDSSASNVDVQCWRRWLAADARHRRAWQGVKAISETLQSASGCSGAMICQMFDQTAAKQRQRLRALQRND